MYHCSTSTMQKIWVYSRWCRHEMPQRQVFGPKGTRFFPLLHTNQNFDSDLLSCKSVIFYLQIYMFCRAVYEFFFLSTVVVCSPHYLWFFFGCALLQLLWINIFFVACLLFVTYCCIVCKKTFLPYDHLKIFIFCHAMYTFCRILTVVSFAKKNPLLPYNHLQIYVCRTIICKWYFFVTHYIVCILSFFSSHFGYFCRTLMYSLQNYIFCIIVCKITFLPYDHLKIYIFRHAMYTFCRILTVVSFAKKNPLLPYNHLRIYVCRTIICKWYFFVTHYIVCILSFFFVALWLLLPRTDVMFAKLHLLYHLQNKKRFCRTIICKFICLPHDYSQMIFFLSHTTLFAYYHFFRRTLVIFSAHWCIVCKITFFVSSFAK